MTGWHPPAAVLELAELVLDGALPALPEGLLPDGVDGEITVEDAEGTPVAVLGPDRRVRSVHPFTHPPLRSRRRHPDQARAELVALNGRRPGPVTAVLIGTIPAADDVERAVDEARRDDGRLLWIAVIGSGRTTGLTPDALLRAVHEAAEAAERAGVPGVVVPVAVPLLPSGPDDDLLRDVARGYGADRVRIPAPASAARPAQPAFAHELALAVGSAHRRGVTVFFTGLSGSGKSTVAKAFTERLLHDGRRTVTLLDGDEVRRLLSSGLGFSRADRDLNIRRIGFVAAEVTRHGGIAVCAPIAPFAQVRAQVRADVEAVGDLVLVHVATPLAECERRDRKGLYLRARRGEIPDFTGISSPYEEPDDADLRIDTTDRTVDDCVDQVWGLFTDRGYLATDS
jgi:sulfate adenylyltransferase